MAGIRRYKGLDQLRGLLALMVVLYHYSLWLNINTGLPFVIQRPLNLLGLYAVSTFFVLSGAALYIVYSGRSVTRSFAREFAIKRIFRICPLFWMVTTATIAFAGFAVLQTELWRVALSYSLLFAWLDPGAYYAIGAWSIGNELAFYSLFPLLLVSWKKKWSRRLLLFSVVVITCYYSFLVIDPHILVSDQWQNYISPWNQLVLFVGGLYVGSLILTGRLGETFWRNVAIGATLLFLAVSYIFSTSFCIHGFVRFTLIGICLLWCLYFGILTPKTGKVGQFLDWIGTLSYSSYLLHPIAFKLTSILLGKILALFPALLIGFGMEIFLTFGIAITVTMVISQLSYSLLERPMVKFGRSMCSKS